MNSPAWAWNEDSSNIVKKYYFYCLFEERSYLSQSPARVKNNVLCRTQMQDMRTPGEAGRVLRLPFSRRHLSVILSDTNEKHLYFICELIHACLRPPRTPIPHAGLLSLLRPTKFSFGRRYQFIVGRLGYGM